MTEGNICLCSRDLLLARCPSFSDSYPQKLYDIQSNPASLPTFCLVSLPSETAALGQTSFATSWGAKDGAAVGASHDCLAVAENGCDIEASLALDIHEVAVG